MPAIPHLCAHRRVVCAILGIEARFWVHLLHLLYFWFYQDFFGVAHSINSVSCGCLIMPHLLECKADDTRTMGVLAGGQTVQQGQPLLSDHRQGMLKVPPPILTWAYTNRATLCFCTFGSFLEPSLLRFQSNREGSL